uniref:Uncharacterized protein n=1 Tax=Lepeophtheirus salmonis TaxID=72036 RepID=A0A0K2TLG9_LEPSM
MYYKLLTQTKQHGAVTLLDEILVLLPNPPYLHELLYNM